MVGAPWADPFFSMNTPEPLPGVAYVFERDDSGNWMEVARLEADVPVARDQFGAAVAIDGDRIVVGAPSLATSSSAVGGAAYVFERDEAGTWTPTTRWEAPAPMNRDGFGSAVALRDGVALVGAPRTRFSEGQGAAYLFTEADGLWSLSETFSDPAGDGSRDQFGLQVALGQDRAVVSAPLAATPEKAGVGEVFVYEPSDGEWLLVDTLIPDDPRYTYPGEHLALDGDRLLLASREFFGATVEVFTRETEGWTLTARLAPLPRRTTTYGPLALQGGDAVVGDPLAKSNPGPVERGVVAFYSDDALEPLVVEIEGPAVTSTDEPYTFTVRVENTTGETVEGDLIFSRDGLGARTLSSGALAPGAVFSATYRERFTSRRNATYTLEVRVETDEGVRGSDRLTVEVVRPSADVASKGDGVVLAHEGVTVAPNPVRGRAEVSFALADAASVRLAVYDALGREVAVLAEGDLGAGEHRATWDASALPAGVYVWRLTADGQVETGRLTVVR